MVTPVPPGMLSQSPWAILIALISSGAEKQKTYPISQEALSCHSCCSHYHITLLGKHQESGYTCATLHVHYLRILRHLGHVLQSKSGNQSAGATPVLWRNSLGPPRITRLCCSDRHFLQMRGRRKSLSTCRHAHLVSTPTTQNVAVLCLLGSSSLQHVPLEPLPKVVWAVPEQPVLEGLPSQPHDLAGVLHPMPPCALLPDFHLITTTKASHHYPFRYMCPPGKHQSL